MSLLNKMLNDLEKRQATGMEGRPQSENVFRSLPPQRGAFGSLLVWGLLIAVVAGMAAWGWSQYHKSGGQPMVAQRVEANNLPKTIVQPVKLQPTAQIEPSLTTTTVVAQVDIGADSQPAKPPIGDGQTAKQVRVAKTNDHAASSARTSAQHKPIASPTQSFKVITPKQQSDNLYRQATAFLQQSRVTDAQNALMQSLVTNPANHNARLLLADLRADAGGNAESAALLREGLELAPGNSGFSMALAHLQVANGNQEEAVTTLEQGLSSANNDAEYHAFLAAILQNRGRHPEAVQHYLTALRSNPSKPNWLIGAGISLKAEKKMNEAAEAFQRAIETGELTLEVTQFSEEQLRQIRQVQ